MDTLEENDTKCHKEKPGIVYLSRIPRRMNVKQIRHVFGSFGEVGRVFLKPIGECALQSVLKVSVHRRGRHLEQRQLMNYCAVSTDS